MGTLWATSEVIEQGIHIQLDLEREQDGHYRLRADAAKLTDELKAKLRELDEASPNK